MCLKKEWRVQQKGYEPVTFDMHIGETQTIRSFAFATNNYVWTKAELQAKVGNTYQTIRKFDIDRTNGMRSVGFLQMLRLLFLFQQRNLQIFVCCWINRLILMETLRALSLFLPPKW